MADEIIDSIEELEEELFPPVPGGIVDRHRQRKAAQKAAEDQAEDAQVPVEQASYRAVKVAAESPEVVSAITYTIAAGQSAMILPQSPYRYRATVTLVTAGNQVTIAKDSGAALGGVGYILGWQYLTETNAFPPAPLVTYTRAQLWAFNNSDSSTQVSVLAEIYAPEGAVPGVATAARR